MLLGPGAGQASAGRPGLRAKLADRRRDFGPWRKQRPFVGGVLVALAGLEMLFLRGPIGLDQLGVNVVLKFGVEGAQATILPTILILLGILSIAQPVHRVFYGVIALAISVYSIAGVNLGGWVAGFLLGVIGGVVVVSWAPPAAVAESEDVGPAGEVTDSADVAQPADGAGARAEDVAPASEDDDVAPASDGAAAPPEADGAAPRAGRGPAADTEAIPQVETLSTALRALSQKSTAVVVASAMALAGMSLPASTSDAGAQQDDSFWCVVFGACDDDGGTTNPSASPTPSTSDPGGSEPGAGAGEDPVGGAVDDITDGVTGPAGGSDGDAGDGKAGDAADGDAGGTKGDDRSECKEPTQDGEVPPEAGSSAPSDPCGEIDPQETIEEALHTELGTCVKVSFGGKYDLNIDLPGQCGVREDGSVFSVPADLESRDLTIPLTGINGIGLANVPVKNNGDRRDAIKISADKVVVDGFWLKSYAYDHDTTAGTDTRANFVALEGNAHMYVSSIHANLPDGQDLLEVATKVLEGASLIELLLTATDARMGFIGATSDVQVWDSFREQVWGDPTNPIGKGPTAGTA
ncbi:hypothetical protein APR04_005061 [Promicromonospora umidemergens]|uniref:Uncharacterized protein n=1 Tax=Promicromonospora umidemergens TaxID=629679 RepID=A0ABN0UNE6_9MICO|nr:DUF6114 domain-containing protein [Promicromonospora umidemergens]MCP2286125.1 hypothetical protein [Promicromonospora umidemergens]